MAALRVVGADVDILPVVAAAEFAGVPIECDIVVSEPHAVLHTSDGAIEGTSAAARFVARCAGSEAVVGRGTFDEAKLDQWMSVLSLELQPPAVRARLLAAKPMLAALINNGIRFSSFQNDLRAELLKAGAPLTEGLTVLDGHLAGSTYLLGDRLTVGDIICAGLTYDLFTLVLTPGSSDAAPSARRWFDSVLHDPTFARAVAKVRIARGGVRREGGLVDVRPDVPSISARADESVAKNAGHKKKATQRDLEKASKDTTPAESAAAAPPAAAAAAAAAASADGARVLPGGFVATAEQPASNRDGPASRDSCIETTVAALAKLGIVDLPMFTHPAAKDMAAMLEHVAGMKGVPCKNLFVKAKKERASDPHDSRMWLVCARHDADTDLKKLAEALGYGKTVIRFGEDEPLLENLGTKPGHVSPFALMNDTAVRVNVCIDAALLSSTEPLLFHPLCNEATLAIQPAQLTRFIESTGHAITSVAFGTKA